jgi:hypothetical protein
MRRMALPNSPVTLSFKLDSKKSNLMVLTNRYGVEKVLSTQPKGAVYFFTTFGGIKVKDGDKDIQVTPGYATRGAYRLVLGETWDGTKFNAWLKIISNDASALNNATTPTKTVM